MNFEEMLINSDCQSVLQDTAKKYGKSIDRGELKSLMLETMWMASKEWSSQHPSNTKLTTFLVNHFKWKIFNLLRSRRQKREKPLDSSKIKDKNSSSHFFMFDLFESLTPSEQALCEDRFINKKTLRSIASEHGVSVQTIITRCEKLKNKIKKMYSEV